MHARLHLPTAGRSRHIFLSRPDSIPVEPGGRRCALTVLSSPGALPGHCGRTAPCPGASDGLQLTLQRAGSGSIVAEASLFADRYHCDALAAEESAVRAVPMTMAKAAIESDPDLASALMRHLAGEVHRTRTRAEILSLKSVAARLDLDGIQRRQVATERALVSRRLRDWRDAGGVLPRACASPACCSSSR
jgi:hypothetical protein